MERSIDRHVKAEGKQAGSGLMKVAFRLRKDDFTTHTVFKTAKDFAQLETSKALLTDSEIDILYTFAMMLAETKHMNCDECEQHEKEFCRDKMLACYKCKKKAMPFEFGVSKMEKDLALKALTSWLRVEWLLMMGWTTDLGKQSFRAMNRDVEVNHATEIRILSKREPEGLLRERGEAKALISKQPAATFKPKAKVVNRGKDAVEVNNAVDQAMEKLFD